ncbi:DUF2332 domain-containing protein [Pseudooceanicola sp. HF7]|uniref:DUF2332 domain-containing protein n=1 Tax=Pseudooceanicola sp. HF7 TaxID=2721560 RepID=UPI0014300E2C|nr:DUF2332 family protein [Pseudooceanicola sp. HF7]NIZ10281.1 DUF2332 family protein [Pseudooceanicola sp. HF7]
MTLAALRDHFLSQAQSCEHLGSPFMARLLPLIAERLAPGSAVAARLMAWPPEKMRADALALRLAGGLHALVLTGADPHLGAAYPPGQPDDDQLWEAVQNAFRQHESHLLHWLDSAPQTNEPRRATALILAAGLAAQQYPGLPLRVSELGASAGLNLQFDRFGLTAGGQRLGAAHPAVTLHPDWQGPRPQPMPFTVAERRGVDLNPLNPDSTQDMLRLRSYIWPDQPDRMERLDAILSVAEPLVDAGDAAAWLADRLAAPRPGRIEFVYHTVAWQYFPPATDAACRATLAMAAERATQDSPLAWLSVEADETGQPGAAVCLRLWPGGFDIPLGRMDFHGRWFRAAEDAPFTR